VQHLQAEVGKVNVGLKREVMKKLRPCTPKAGASRGRQGTRFLGEREPQLGKVGGFTEGTCLQGGWGCHSKQEKGRKRAERCSSAKTPTTRGRLIPEGVYGSLLRNGVKGGEVSFLGPKEKDDIWASSVKT